MAGTTVHKGSVGDWIEPVALPKADPQFDSQIKNGISNLLSDYQIRKRPGGLEVFDRYAYKIVDRTGLERGASISFEFDPATSEVTVNWIDIIRDGVVIKHLSDADFDVFRRERDAEKGLFDGWLTAYLNLNDVRVGDIVDYGKTTAELRSSARIFFSIPLPWPGTNQSL
ncbi:DUF3857 domain-containing protein [Mesorhizobium sp. f-mel]